MKGKYNANSRSDPIGFAGQYGHYIDFETSSGSVPPLLCLTHRYYDPATGRFVNRDPIGYDGGINLYTFAGGNPVNRTDPFGTQVQESALQLLQRLANGPGAQRISNYLTQRGSQYASQFAQMMSRSSATSSGVTRFGTQMFGSYSSLSRSNAANQIVANAHHFLQNAAFSKYLPQAMRIPRGQGLSVNLNGNIFTQANSAHWKSHQVIEAFWEQYRTGPKSMQTPTVGEYVQAMRASLQAAGLNRNEVGYAIGLVKQQFQQYGIPMAQEFNRVPNRINMAKP